MSRVQRFFTAIFPARWAKSIEAESRSWMVRCQNCESARSVWDMGGIRWKASGKPKTYILCGACGQLGWHVISREAPTA